MLYIANMGCARISVCLLIKNILPGPTSRCTALVFAGLSFLWTVSGILVSAFRCQLPRPWDFAGNKCFDVIRFVNYVGVTNIVVEVLLIMIPLFVWNLRLTAGRRASVSSVFIARLRSVFSFAAIESVANINQHCCCSRRPAYFLQPLFDFARRYIRLLADCVVRPNRTEPLRHHGLSTVSASLHSQHPIWSYENREPSLRVRCEAKY